MNKRFLFLQGPSCPFFEELGKAIRSNGHHVAKLNFNGGDELYWRIGNAHAYRHTQEELGGWYRELFEREAYTDIVLFGDRRPIHVSAIEVAKEQNIRVHVFEEGYFRPYWITMERGGVNACSQLPKDPSWYRRVGPGIPAYDNGRPFPPSFAARAWHDIVYNVANVRNRFSYPGYRTHALVPPHIEYSAYLRRAFNSLQQKKQDQTNIQTLIYGRLPFWLVPLQLNSDAQIRHHSRFSGMAEMLEQTLSSFARACRPDAYLVIKNHPLDSGLHDYPKILKNIADTVGLKHERIIYLESGSLPALLNHARGVVTVNSTVGGSALVHGRPLIALGQAIYNMPGLTYQGDLDTFWRRGKQPDQKLFQWFRNTVIHATQLNGGLYSRQSIEMSVKAAVPRMLAERSIVEQLLLLPTATKLNKTATNPHNRARH